MKAFELDPLHLSDRNDADAEEAPLTIEQAAELDRRMEDYRKHPETSIPWETAREQMRRGDRLAVLRDALDVGIVELDAGKGVESSPEELMNEVFVEVGLQP